MKAHYQIYHVGQPIAMAGTIEQARAIVKESRTGRYEVLEVCDDPRTQPSHKARTWGFMIHQDDGPVVIETPIAMTPELVH